MRTQWRVGFNGVVGLDYAALDVVMGWMGVNNRPATFRRVRLIERGFLLGLRGGDLEHIYG